MYVQKISTVEKNKSRKISALKRSSCKKYLIDSKIKIYRRKKNKNAIPKNPRSPMCR